MLEIAIALAFVFLLLSLIVTELTELFANALKLRAKTLREGLEGMLGDKTVADQVLKHPLVRSDLREDSKHPPSYIAPRDFAAAFRDVVSSPDSVEEDSRATVRVLDADGESHSSEISGRLAAQLRTLSGSAAVAPAVTVIERWFNESMDRVSGWYKRKAKWITLALATIVVLGLNVSALRIAERLAEEPTVRAAVVVKAEAAADEGSADQEGLKDAGKEMEGAVKELDALKLPVFWAGENVPDNWEELGVAAIGWLISIFAISLGAPFWFDALSKLSNLRMAGKKPEEKAAS